MGKFKMVIIVVLLLVAVGAGTYFFIEQKVEGSDNDKLSAEEIAEMSIDTDVITTNLGPSNFAVVQFNILLDSKDAKAEAEKRTPEVRAAVISTVTGFAKDELVGEGGIALLEEALLEKLDGIMEKGNVERVLVTEFKIQ